MTYVEEEEVKTQTCREGRPHEETRRKWPTTSHGKRLRRDQPC